MNIAIPKFHDRPSLILGIVSGLVLVTDAVVGMVYQFNGGRVVELLIGLGLVVHMADTYRLYRKHRIIKIVKTDKERIVYQGNYLLNRIGWWGDALKFAWGQWSFRLWVVICSLGIIIGLLAGIGMTSLVLLVAIACLGWGMELANSGIETLLDIVHPDYSEKVKIVKDAFAAVPIFVFGAYVVCWLILVVPTLIERLL